MNKPIIITGCQRSGTTLLSLILDSHPQIRSVDEIEFDGSKLNEYLGSPAYYPSVAFKLPGDAPFFYSFRMLPGVKVLWCVRDPRDVVLSMINLKMEIINGKYIVWANYDLGAKREIDNCQRFIDTEGLPAGMQEYQRISRTAYHLRDRKDAVLMGALCWELKNRLLDFYPKENFPFMVVTYEDLVRKPEPTMKEVLSFLELPWHDDVLRHYELHNGMHTGNTHGNKPIDPSHIGRWRDGLSEEEVAVIESLCAKSAGKLGYDLAAR